MTKLSISRAWDESRAVLAHDGKLIGTVALALFVLPGVVLNVAMPGGHTSELLPAGVSLVVGLVAVLVSLVGQLSVVRLAMGPHVSVGEAISHAARRLLPFVGAVLLWTVPFLLVGSVLYAAVGTDPDHPSGIAAIALLLLTGFGLFIAVRLILMSAVACAEDIGSIRILRRSWDLTRGNWWRLFAFLLLFAIGAVILIFAVQAVAGTVGRLLFGELTPLSVGGLIVSLLVQLVSAVVSVFLFVMLTRIYLQLAGSADATVSVPSSGI